MDWITGIQNAINYIEDHLTEELDYPVDEIDELRRQAVSEWLPTSGYELRNAPEIGVIHWYWEEGNEKLNSSRYCEIWLPIAKI